MEIEALNIGRLNRVNGKNITYSGKALNVAIVLSRLKGESYATGFMFNENGRLFEQNLDREGVPNTFVWNKGSVRTNYKFIDKKSMMTEVNDKGEEVSEEKQSELLELVSNLSKKCDYAIMSGSLPSGVNNDFYLKLSKAMPKTVKKVIDTEGDKMLLALENGAVLVKPNKTELEEFAKKELTSKKDVLKACYTLLDKGAENVLVSLGREGAIITNGIKNYFCKSIQVAVNSTVGAGDSMVAAAVLQMEQGAVLADVLKNGVAAGTAAITKSGTLLCTREKYLEVLEGLKVEEI
jgi:1-phosphofructokinase family hexose kinase